MAAELFSNFAEFKTYVGGRINTSIKLESLDATIYETARRHITPWLGLEFYEYLVAGSGLTGEEEDLLPYVKRPLAILTMYEWSKVGAIEVGESGMHRIESETRKSAYRYQERKYEEDALEKGYNALELLLRYLDTNKADFGDWAESEEGLAHRTPLLNYASDFRFLTLPECDRYTFECIRPIIAEVEKFGIEKQLPAEFWEGFIGRHLDGSLTDEEVLLRKYIRQSIAHRSIEEAVKQRWIRIDKGRVAVHEDFGEQRATNMTMPTGTGAGLYLSHVAWSDRFTSLWQDFIRNNAEAFDTIFDEASGGTNTDADAWHINTEAEQEEADADLVVTKSQPVYRF